MNRDIKRVALFYTRSTVYSDTSPAGIFAPITMKRLLLLLLLLRQFSTPAQPVFLTEDGTQRKMTDGYRGGFLVDSPKEIDGILFFSTPNFRLYQSDGTAAGTKMLVQFPDASLVYVQAVTKRFVYFTMRTISGSHTLFRLDRLTLKQEFITLYQKPLALEISDAKVFVHPSKNLVAVRLHMGEKKLTLLVTLADDEPKEAKLVATDFLNQESQLITRFSDVAFMDKQVYYNGFRYEESTGKKEFEYVIASAIPATKPGGQDYELKNYYSLRAKGYELNDHFYTIDDSLFAIGFFQNKATNSRDLFVGSLHPQTLRVPATLPTDQNFAWGEVLDHSLYLVNGTRLLRWVPGSNDIQEVYRKRTYQYQHLLPYRSLLKCGNFIVYREEDSLTTFNQQTKTFTYVTKPEAFIPANSLYKQMDHYTWATSRYIYYVTYKGFTPSFTQYDPVTKQSTPVTFPEFKGEQFNAFLAIFQTGDKFLFMTKYLGKKDTPVYRIFGM